MPGRRDTIMTTAYSRKQHDHVAGVLLWICLASPLQAEDAFYLVPLDTLTIVEGKLPMPPTNLEWHRRAIAPAMMPYVVLEGAGEAYPGTAVGWPVNLAILPADGFDSAFSPTVEPMEGLPPAETEPLPDLTDARHLPFAVRLDAKSQALCTFRRVTGRAWPACGSRCPLPRRLNAPAQLLSCQEGPLSTSGVARLPGNAWFRHQAAASQLEVSRRTAESVPRRRCRSNVATRQRVGTHVRAASGGRAVSENLQLDRVLPTSESAEETFELARLKSITIPELDWSRLNQGPDPRTDRLAALIPADQHAVFFPSLQALISTVDEAVGYGTSVLHWMQPRAEDARSLAHYQQQLCLEIDALSRLLGPRVIQNVAVTGSDPYLRTGTDVAVLFQSDSPVTLQAFLHARQTAAARQRPDSRPSEAMVGPVSYQAVVTPDRSVCSYVGVLDNVVVVTNSLASSNGWRLATKEIWRCWNSRRSIGSFAAATGWETKKRQRCW